MKKKKFNAKELKDVIEVLVSEAENIDDEEDLELQKAILIYLSKTIDMKVCDEDIFWMLDYTLDNIKKKFLKEHSNFKDNQIRYIIEYDFIKQIIAKIIEKLESSVCSVDKAGYIVRKVIDYKNDKNVSIENGLWYTPKKGSISDWENMVDACLNVKYGYVDKLILAYKNILTLYTESGDDSE